MTTTTYTQPRPCTKEQVTLIAQLVTERHITPDLGAMIGRAREQVMTGTLSFAAAHTLINALIAAPRPARLVPVAAPAPEGMHILNGVMYRVVKSNRGNLYAQSLEFTEYGARKIRFTKAPGVIRRLSAATKMTHEQAAAFGRQHHFCCNCGIHLEDLRSTTAGYGPVCAANNGWPWGSEVAA